MNTPRIDWPATVTTAPLGYRFGAHTTVPGGEAYYLIREADDRAVLAVQRPDLDAEDAPEASDIDELLGHVVTVGSVLREHVGEGCERDDLSAYVSLRVTVDGAEHQIGTMVGVRPANQGSARASGCGASGTYLATWQEERSDLEGLTEAQREAVEAALYEARARLWAEVEALRA